MKITNRFELTDGHFKNGTVGNDNIKTPDGTVLSLLWTNYANSSKTLNVRHQSAPNKLDTLLSLKPGDKPQTIHGTTFVNNATA